MTKWDERLITPDRAFALAGEWPLFASYELAELSQFGPEQIDRVQNNLRCGRCKQSVALLGEGGTAGETTVAELLAGVLRHLVMAHDVPLSGAGRESP